MDPLSWHAPHSSPELDGHVRCWLHSEALQYHALPHCCSPLPKHADGRSAVTGEAQSSMLMIASRIILPAVRPAGMFRGWLRYKPADKALYRV